MTTPEQLITRLRQLVKRAEGLVHKNPKQLAEQLNSLADLASSLPQPVAPSNGEEPGASPAVAALSIGSTQAEAGTLQPSDADTQQPAAKKAKKVAREFDFTKYRQRHIALEVMYVGWSYHGFARQDNTENTIEGHLFAALRRTRLIPPDVEPQALRYSRCGRTDKGVSALGQVVALMLRSNARSTAPSRPADNVAAGAVAAQAGEQDGTTTGTEAGGAAAAAGDEGEPFPPPEQEIDYPRILNRALPEEIRVLGWTPVPDNFHARFSARYREYKYFIVDSDGSLDIPRMQAAADRFVGQHDFRNFCKLDVLAVKSFDRKISSFHIAPVGIDATVPNMSASSVPNVAAPLQPVHVQDHATAGMTSINHAHPPLDSPAAGQEASARSTSGRDAVQHSSSYSRVYAMTIRGSAFLWHQVRCMAAVLLMVGRGQEEPEIVSRLLDIGATPCKPTYNMAAEEPLLLYACGFEGLSFRRHARLVDENTASLRARVDHHLVAAALTAAAAGRIAVDAATEPDTSEARGGGGGKGNKGANTQQAVQGASGAGRSGKGGGPPHVPLLRRPTEASVEERMRKHGLPWPPVAAGGGGGDMDVE